MEQLAEVQPTLIEWRWPLQPEGKNIPRIGPRGRARLVVLAGEIGGRWSGEVASVGGGQSEARTTDSSTEGSALGGPGGQHCCFVQLYGPMVTFLRHLRCCGGGATQVWANPIVCFSRAF